ncbi:hypothetical protein [Nocardia carnea]|nr:hypothetical protein [Nocardia carnea]
MLRSAGPADPVVAAAAELRGLTLLHSDSGFDCAGAVTGRPVKWIGRRN